MGFQCGCVVCLCCWVGGSVVRVYGVVMVYGLVLVFMVLLSRFMVSSAGFSVHALLVSGFRFLWFPARFRSVFMLSWLWFNV